MFERSKKLINVDFYSQQKMWWLAPTIIGQCDNGYNYWIQPQHEIAIDPPTVNAWCYPTAAASLLAYKKDKWSSKHKLNYPQTYNEEDSNKDNSDPPKRNVTSWDPSTPWADYIYHKENPLNLGNFMNTQTNVGTTLDNGRQGLQDFLNANKHAQYDATVTDISKQNNQNDNDFLTEHKDKLPFLVHISPKCCGVFPSENDGNSFDDPVEISSTNEDSSPYGSQTGHTIVIWELKENQKWHGASNHEKERNNPNEPGVRTCTGTNFAFQGDSCITAITTVSFSETPASASKIVTPRYSERPTDSDSSDNGLVIGLAVGFGVLGVSIIAFIAYKWNNQRLNGRANFDPDRLLG